MEVEVGLLADEALVVPGPWLAATTSGRPHVRWVCKSARRIPGSPRPQKLLRDPEHFEVTLTLLGAKGHPLRAALRTAPT